MQDPLFEIVRKCPATLIDIESKTMITHILTSASTRRISFKMH